MLMEKVIRNLAALQEEASSFVRALAPHAEEATLVTLSGELGAGKTAFTQAAAKALGVEDAVTSPTFVLEKIYLLPPGRPFTHLVHIDAYRLEEASELRTLGFDALMREPKNLIMLEWPEKVADALPTPQTRISLIPHEDGSRTLIYG
jgi:tRNA threonylcarbamoyladenosine biosynthesis protein TsaE